MASNMPRTPEPEPMDLPEEAVAYAAADFAAVNQDFVERLLEVVGDRDSARAIDFGTGPADIPIRVAAARPSWRISAIDMAPAMLEIARAAVASSGLEDRIELVLGDAKSSPLPAGTFDVVFSNSILHHVEAPSRLWSEVRRVAAPDARLFFRDLRRPASEAAARQIVAAHAGDATELLQEEYYRSLLAAYTVEEVRDQLARAGLGQLNVRTVADRYLDVTGQLP